MRLAFAALLAAALLPAAPALAQDPVGICEEARRALATQSGNAIATIETCLDGGELEPESEVALYAGLGALHLANEDYADALTALNLAFAIADTHQARIVNPSTWRNRGIARAQLDQTDGALRDLNIAARAMPSDVLTHLNLGILYQQLDQPEQAVIAYDRIVQLEPEWVGAWINRSSALLDAGMTRAAVEDARRAVELEPNNGSTLNMLCWTLIQDNRAELALPLCEQAVAAEPEIGAIVHSHAAALEAVGRIEEALPLYRRAHQLSPDDPEIAADYERTHG